MSRGAMTHRADLRRGNGGTNAWNQPAEQTFDEMSSLGIVPCRVYHETRGDARLVVSDDKTARVDEMFAMFPLDLDVRTEDRLGDVMDRRDGLLFEGPFVIRQPKRRARFIEAKLEGHNVGV